MHILLSILMCALLLSGCAKNLSAVRGFANETKKISVAFNPILEGAVEHCRQQFLQRRAYTTSTLLSNFDAEVAIEQASVNCQPIENDNATAKRLSKVLADYANQLSAIAADDVAVSISDDYDTLEAELNEFEDASSEKIGAISSLLKFLTKNKLAKTQHDAIVEALSYEEGVGVLADALVIYSDRVFGGYIAERLVDQPLLIEALHEENASPILTRLQLIEIYHQTQNLVDQQNTIISMRTAVEQMKLSIRDLRLNIDELSAPERLREIEVLAKDVRVLYDQLSKAF